MHNKIAKNRKSPSNEPNLISHYKRVVKAANKKNDKLDVAAVITKSGDRGHSLMAESKKKGRKNYELKNRLTN